MRDRPINSHGFYNLNFIDWQNEWERVLDEDSNTGNYTNGENGELYNVEIYNIILKKSKQLKITKEGKTCSICMLKLEIADNVFKLKCKHLFHSDCFKPWAKKHSTCPNCRTDLTE